MVYIKRNKLNMLKIHLALVLNGFFYIKHFMKKRKNIFYKRKNLFYKRNGTKFLYSGKIKLSKRGDEK